MTLLNEDAHPQGSIVSAAPSGIDVACGKGLLRITEVQRAGGKRVTAAEFLHGSKLTIGDCFELAPEAAP